MSDWVVRSPVEYFRGASPSTMKALFPAETWIDASGNAVTNPTAIHNPNLTAVAGQPVKYWKLNGDLVELMTAGEQTVVDDAESTSFKDALSNDMNGAHPSFHRAFAEILIDEFNILRGQHAFANRTLAQLKTALRNKLDG